MYSPHRETWIAYNLKRYFRQSHVDLHDLLFATARAIKQFRFIAGCIRELQDIRRSTLLEAIFMLHSCTPSQISSPKPMAKMPNYCTQTICLKLTDMKISARARTLRVEWLHRFHACPFEPDMLFYVVLGRSPRRFNPIRSFQVYTDRKMFYRTRDYKEGFLSMF